MAKRAKSGVNVAEEIRAYCKENRTAKPKEVAEALKARGIHIKPQYVSTIRTMDKKKRGTKRAGGKAPSSAGDYADVLLRAKKLAEQLGGVEKAKIAIDTLSRLGL